MTKPTAITIQTLPGDVAQQTVRKETHLRTVPDIEPSETVPLEPAGNDAPAAVLPTVPRRFATSDGARVRKIAPGRKTDAECGHVRSHLTPDEVEGLVRAAKARGRYGNRDATAIMMAARHGLRASELCELRWDQVDFAGGWLHVVRRKKGDPSTHPLDGREMRALRALQRAGAVGRFVFMTERGGPMTPAGFARMLQRAAADAGFTSAVYPHQLRHACGYRLVNEAKDTRAIQHWLGHKNIRHTVLYTKLNGNQFKGW